MTAFDPDVVRPRSWPRTEHDDLPIPGGLTVGAVETDELRRLFESRGVPGVSAEQGRDANVRAYARHVDRIRNEGATAALNAWLAQ